MFFLSSRNKRGRILRALVLLSASLAGGSCFVKQAPAATLPAEAAAFIRGFGNQGGDIFLWDARTKQQRQLTHGKQFSDLGVTRGKIACLSSPDGSIYLLRAPDWHPERLPVGIGYSGKPCWIEGKNQFLIGRSRWDGVDGDGGLWQIDVDQSSARRLLPNYDSDFSVSDRLLLSPQHDRALSLGGGADALVLRVVNLQTGSILFGMSREEVPGGEDAAWLDETHLLLACSSDTPNETRTQGGLRLLNIKTHQISQWLYSANAQMTQITRSNSGTQFAIVQDAPMRGEVVDRVTKVQHLLPFKYLTTYGYSANDSELLVGISSSFSADTSNIYVLDIRTNQKHFVARNVSEAVWLIL